MLDTKDNKKDDDGDFDNNNNIVGYRALLDANKQNPGDEHGDEDRREINNTTGQRCQTQSPGQLDTQTLEESDKS